MSGDPISTSLLDLRFLTVHPGLGQPTNTQSTGPGDPITVYRVLVSRVQRHLGRCCIQFGGAPLAVNDHVSAGSHLRPLYLMAFKLSFVMFFFFFLC